jgi:hypothetical protein
VSVLLRQAGCFQDLGSGGVSPKSDRHAVADVDDLSSRAHEESPAKGMANQLDASYG